MTARANKPGRPRKTTDNRAILRLREEEGLSFSEIGARLGIGRSLAWLRYRQAIASKNRHKSYKREENSTEVVEPHGGGGSDNG